MAKLGYNAKPLLKQRDVAQFGSALALGARCRRFESCRPDHFCGRSSLVEPQPSKLMRRVRFPSPAPEMLQPRRTSWAVFVAIIVNVAWRATGIEPMRWNFVKKTCRWHVFRNSPDRACEGGVGVRAANAGVPSPAPTSPAVLTNGRFRFMLLNFGPQIRSYGRLEVGRGAKCYMKNGRPKS